MEACSLFGISTVGGGAPGEQETLEIAHIRGTAHVDTLAQVGRAPRCTSRNGRKRLRRVCSRTPTECPSKSTSYTVGNVVARRKLTLRFCPGNERNSYFFSQNESCFLPRYIQNSSALLQGYSCRKSAHSRPALICKYLELICGSKRWRHKKTI